MPDSDIGAGPAALLLALLVAFAAFGINGCVDEIRDRRHEAKLHADREADCRALHPTYGKVYMAVSGPYTGVRLVAIQFELEKIGLRPQHSNDELVFLLCGDLKEVTK